MRKLTKLVSLTITIFGGIVIWKKVYDKKNGKYAIKKSSDEDTSSKEKNNKDEVEIKASKRMQSSKLNDDLDKRDRKQELDNRTLTPSNASSTNENKESDLKKDIAETEEMTKKVKEKADQTAKEKMSDMQQRHEEANQLMKQHLTDIFDTSFEQSDFEKRKQRTLSDELDDLLK